MEGFWIKLARIALASLTPESAADGGGQTCKQRLQVACAACHSTGHVYGGEQCVFCADDEP